MGGTPSKSKKKKKEDDIYVAPVAQTELLGEISGAQKQDGVGQQDDVVLLGEGDTWDTSRERRTSQDEENLLGKQKTAAKVAESAPDRSKTIMKARCEFFDDVQVRDGTYAATKTKLNHVYYLINKKYSTDQYFYRTVADFPLMEHYLVAEEWNGIVLQFRSTSAPTSIHEKRVSRFHFLSLLKELDMTQVERRAIDERWDPNVSNHLTTQDEPLLLEFEAVSVLSFYQDENHESHGRQSLRAGNQYGSSVISIKQAVMIVMEEILAQASTYKKREAAHTTYNLSTEDGMKRMKKKKELAEARVKRKNVGKLGRMLGTRGSIKELVLAMRDYLRHAFRPTLDEVYYFEWTFSRQGPMMRRNAAWEFLYAMEADDIVRPLQLMQGVSTLNTERPNFSIATAVPNSRKILNERTWEIRQEEKTRFCLAKWLRAKTMKLVHLTKFQDESESNTPANRLLQERFGIERARLAEETAKANRLKKRLPMSVVFPAMEERLRREEQERKYGASAASEHLELLDAMDGLREPEDHD